MTRRLLILTLLVQVVVFARAPIAGAQDCPQATGSETFRGELVEIEELEADDSEAEVDSTGEETDTDEDEDGADETAEEITPPKEYRVVLLETLEDTGDEDTGDEDTAGDSEDDAEDTAPTTVQREFLLLGKGDKLDVGSMYLVTLTEFNLGVTYPDRVAYLGEGIPCADEITVLAVDDDGGTSEIDISGFDLPSLPIDPRQVVIAFGALALITFLFREPRVNQ